MPYTAFATMPRIERTMSTLSTLLALEDRPDDSRYLQPVARFLINPVGSAIVNAVGPIHQPVKGCDAAARKYLEIASLVNDRVQWPVQQQSTTL